VIPSHINNQKLKRKKIIFYAEFHLTDSIFLILRLVWTTLVLYLSRSGEPGTRVQHGTNITWGLFHDAITSVMTGENTSQNDNSDWSPFHWTKDKRNATSKLQQGDSKYEPLDECLFHKDIFLSETLTIV